MLYFEDFSPGQTFDLGKTGASQDEIIAFAKEFDPQPFHVDPIAAKDSFNGQLIGSGWHTAALLLRLTVDNLLSKAAALGSPGLIEGAWRKPFLPGDELRAEVSVSEAKLYDIRPALGKVLLDFALINPRDEVMYSQKNWVLVLRRGHENPRPFSVVPPPPAEPLPIDDSDVVIDARGFGFIEEIEEGFDRKLGSLRFTPEDIVRYARQFDPQPFHLSEEGAAKTHFGRLCASGFHTGSGWMKRMVACFDAANAIRREKGLPIPRLGPSPGITNMVWKKPVYAGDVIRYGSIIKEKKLSPVWPRWGRIFTENYGINQHGQKVMSFEACTFVERLPVQ